MLSTLAMTIRVSFGIFLGLFLGAIGLYFGWFVSPPGPTVSTGLLITCCGLGAGVGGFISYFKPEVPSSVNIANISIALAGGLIGAWAGWSIGYLIYPEGVYNPAAPVRTPPFVVAVLLASAGANICSCSFYTYRLFRHREI